MIVSGPAVRLLSDIRVALGVGGSGLGQIYTNASPNPFAKYKPVRYNKTSALTDAERATQNYGTNVPVINNTDFPTVGVWGTNKPRGSAYNEWFRMLDMLGYNTACEAPIKFEWIEPNWTATSVTFPILFDAGTGTTGITNNIKINEVFAHSSVYWGGSDTTLYFWIGIYKGDGKSTVYCKRCEKSISELSQIGQGWTTIVINPSTDFSGALYNLSGEYTVMFFVGGVGPGTTTTNPNNITHKLSLAYVSGADKKLYNTSAREWNTGLSFSQNPSLSGSGGTWTLGSNPLSFSRTSLGTTSSLYYEIRIDLGTTGDYFGYDQTVRSKIIATGYTQSFGAGQSINVTPSIPSSADYTIHLRQGSTSHYIVVTLIVYPYQGATDSRSTAQTIIKTY